MLVREIINYSSYWRSTTFASTVEPTIYLLAFGFGFGSLVATVGGYDYVEFVGTGTVATAIMFSSVFATMYGTYFKREFQRTYDAILAAPVDTEELVTGEILWVAARAGVYGSAPMLVAMVFGLDPSWGMLAVPLIAFITGFGWAAFGVLDRGDHEVGRHVLLRDEHRASRRLFLVAGTYFPLDRLPEWAQSLGQINPLYHCVELVRARRVRLATGWVDVGHVAALVGFGLVMWRLAIWRTEKRLID